MGYNKEAAKFHKLIEHNEYNVINQLKKTPARISFFFTDLELKTTF
jgi:hypothetical protein